MVVSQLPIYYRTKEEYDGDYYKGTYEAYHGQEALDKVVSLEQYGITEEEIEHDTVYIGYYIEKVGMIDLLNIGTANSAVWVLQ